MKNLIIILAFLSVSGSALTQCPTNLADFVDGGTFSGTCTVTGTTSTVTITGDVVWGGGVLEIASSSGSGHLTIDAGASLSITGGTVNVNDNSNGRILVDGSLSISAGATINSHERINVNGTMTVNGTATSAISHLNILSIGTVNVSSTGTITTGGTGDNLIEGTLNSAGTLNINGDLEINGGRVEITAGTLTVGTFAPPTQDRDLLVYNGGSFSLAAGATAYIDDDFFNNVNQDNDGGAGATQAEIEIHGDLYVAGEMTIYDTTPNSTLEGTGTITVTAGFEDQECAEYVIGGWHFCNCTGGGQTCSGTLLPIVLTDFSAVQEGNAMLLLWETATEINNDIFSIEKLEDDDSFRSLATVAGAGNSHTPRRYQAYDLNPSTGNNYYRLRQTDYDGTTTVSNVIRGEFNAIATGLEVFPNPSTNLAFTVQAQGLAAGQDADIQLMTVHGCPLKSVRVKADETGKITSTIEVAERGAYIIEIGNRRVKAIAE